MTTACTTRRRPVGHPPPTYQTVTTTVQTSPHRPHRRHMCQRCEPRTAVRRPRQRPRQTDAGPQKYICAKQYMGNVASSSAPRRKRTKKASSKNKSPPANAAKPNAPKLTVNSRACTYNAASNHWQCVHRRASTVNNINANSWDGFWVNDMPYSLNNNNSANNAPKKKKTKK